MTEKIVIEFEPWKRTYPDLMVRLAHMICDTPSGPYSAGTAYDLAELVLSLFEDQVKSDKPLAAPTETMQ